MTNRSTTDARRVRLAAGVLLIFGLAVATLPARPSMVLQAQDPSAKSKDADEEVPGPKYCGNCHLVTANDDPKSGIYWRGEQWRGWQADPHRTANSVLDGPLGKRMAFALGKHGADPATWANGVRGDPRCISCHGGTKGANVVDQSEGLSCNDCHQIRGGSGKWILSHALRKELAGSKNTAWRSLAQTKKVAAGFQPLHDAAVRGDVCMSCHVGNLADGKFVTHEMYAAGHPPLPSIELAKFSEDAYTEKHWLDSAEPRKVAAGIVEDFTAWKASLAVQGGLTALRAQAGMAALAAAPPDGRPDLKWGDYAMFDCASCHHDLADPSWRRRRAERGADATGAKVYGRPPLLEWPAALALAADDKGLLTPPLSALRRAATEPVFGDAKTVANAAAALQPALNGLATAGGAPEARRAQLRRTLDIGKSEDRFWDFDSARQLAWQAEALGLSVKGPAFLGEPRQLPRWTDKSKALPDLQAADRLAGLSAALDAKRRYDPAAFRKWCRDAHDAEFPAAARP